MREGGDVTLIATGAALPRALEAADSLRAEGIAVRLLSMPCVKPLDGELLLKAAKETGKIVTVEEHYVAGGLGSAVAEFLVQQHPVHMRMIGVQDRFPSSGPYDGLLGESGLLAPQIAEVVRRFVR